MKLAIKYVREHGNLEKERIILKALDDVNIGDYLLADTTYINDNEVSNMLRHTFWVPDKNVKKGDLIVIYTKRGSDSVKRNNSGTTHFFYWGMKRTIWHIDEDAAALFHIGNWVSKKV